MFLEKLIERNPFLVDESIKLYNKGLIQADSYVIDIDTLLSNAKKILDKAKDFNIKLYFMLKQLGRNPYIAKRLVELGYEGAVAVDYREALMMIKHNIPLSNVGHLVQTPKNILRTIIEYGTEVMTVYSIEKLAEINQIAGELGKNQQIMLKVAGEQDLFYSGQYSGIELSELGVFIEKTRDFKNVKIVGVTAFPCYLFSCDSKDIEETNNYHTVVKAVEIMKSKGLNVTHINTPSTTSVLTLDKIRDGIGNIGEPGHGFTGSTPAHAYFDLDEIPCVEYISEVSHNFRGKAYVYGGGYYRRSHLENCLVVDGETSHVAKVNPMADDSIDYYFELDGEETISSIAVMSFRFQIFVTRSNVVLVEGIQTGDAKIVGVYNSLGDEINE